MRSKGLAFGVCLTVLAPSSLAIGLTWGRPSQVLSAAPPAAALGVAPPRQRPRPPRRVLPLPHGEARVVERLSVRSPVVFITIDDGWYRDPRVARLIVRRRIPVTVFLTRDAAMGPAQAYWRALARGRVAIETHTVTHPFLRGRPFSRQRAEICRPVPSYERWFGRRSRLMRPPYGSYDRTTLRAARACGIGAAVMWTAEMRHGRLLAEHPLRRGDIVLLHFRRELYVELTRLLRMMRARGLRPALLEDYLHYG